MSNIRAIAKRELRSYFSSPVAYVFIVIFLLLAGFFTFMAGNFFERRQANLDAFFMWHPWLYVFLVPCVGMRLWAEERRVGTIELLLTKPITPLQAIVGKFVASWAFLGIALALTFPVLVTVNLLGSPDNGTIIAAYLGSFLMAGAYLAISCATSAMTRNQVVSFIISAVICLFLVLCGDASVTNLLTRLDKPWLVDLVSSFSFKTHFQQFTTGLVDSRDVIFFLLVIGFALFTNGVIIRSHRATSLGGFMKARSFEALLYSAGGVAAMFLLMLATYVLTSAVKVRLDISADKAHTLSPGTKRILAKLDSRVTLRFYCSQSDNDMPPELRAYARHIDDLLREYEQQAKGNLRIEKFDPKPDSEAEDSARLNGIEGRPTGSMAGDKVYLGIVVSLLDEKFVLPWLAPQRERLLEYDISRAISRVISRTRPAIGIMSGLQVFGEAVNPMLVRPGETHAEDWMFVTELKKDFDVIEVPLSSTNIADRIKVLVVVHPVGISDTAQMALDQFVLRGGKLLAFLDPHAFFDQKHDPNPAYSMVGDNAARSSLDKLLKAWGLGMDLNKIVADQSFAGRNMQTGDTMPTLLLVNRAGIDQNDVVTCQIDNLFMPFAGALTGTPIDGLKESVLVKSSPNSELVDGMLATAAAKILRDFKPSNIEYPLAIRLSGNFKSAFSNASGLKDSAGRGEVVLVSDTDMLNDQVCVRVQKMMGQRVVQPMNGNLNFLQSLVEQFTGDDDLINSRSRASMSRPFTRLQQLEAKAGRQWEAKIQVLDGKRLDTEQKIKDLQAQNLVGQQRDLILSPEQEKELESYRATLVSVSKELKQVRKNLREDTDALEFWTKVGNIGTVPTLVAMSGLGLAIIRNRRRGPKRN
ncbi:MAG: hypothetical protein C5B50_09055 [Verrucomicrobia bacterium]|nr:MAG: hypothetical protein C5B50_09055 [Verrucomicrobiota bacterium]